jgi:hypothetical protein
MAGRRLHISYTVCSSIANTVLDVGDAMTASHPPGHPTDGAPSAAICDSVGAGAGAGFALLHD